MALNGYSNLSLRFLFTHFKQIVMETKKDLITKFKDILNKLIKQNKLNYYPFKRDLKYFDKDLLKEGIRIYKEKLEND